MTRSDLWHVVAVMHASCAVRDLGLAYAPYADLLWCETSTPDLQEAKQFAAGIHSKYPGKMLAYNCSPSFNWKRHLDESTIAKFQRELGAMGYKFQFVTLAGFHALNHGMFELSHRVVDANDPDIFRLLTHLETHHVPVFAFAETKDHVQEENLMRAGAAMFLSKPIDIDTLLTQASFLAMPRR